MDPDLAVTQMAPMAELMDMSVTEQRFNMWLLSRFAFVVIGMTACWLPARQTGRVDPVSVLRAE